MNRFMRIFQYIHTHRDLSLAVGLVLLILMLIIPLPTALLDVALSINLLLSILIVLNVLYLKSALEFTVFPTILLISTLFSLVLNISSTRSILTLGENFEGAIIRSFGNFVVGSSGTEGLVVGLIIFIIIIIIQFIVITKGSARVAEVAARFRLDSLPGKQIAIDAEFSSGTITEEEYNKKKSDLQQEVDFYGSMDGASKFVSGNVKAGLLITFINIVGGLIVGIVIRGESINSAFVNYIQLTVGDGLISQLPGLLISSATGIIVTRSVSKGNLTEDLAKEFGNYKKIYYVAGGFLLLLGILPGFPWYILIPMGLLLIGAAILSMRQDKNKIEDEKKREEHSETTQVEIPQLEPLDPIALEIGYDLVPLLQNDNENGNNTAELLNRISSIRREIGVKYGIVVPLMRVVDNYMLDSSAYSIKMNGIEIGKGHVHPNNLLAIPTQSVNSDIELDGEDTIDPAFGLPAKWIAINNKAKAERAGYTVADATAVISTHIASLIEAYAPDLINRQDVAKMIDQYNETHPTTIKELRSHLNVGQIHHVFKRLLQERVSLRNLTSIFETLGDYGAITKDIDFLVEKCRQALSRQISGQYMDEYNTLYAYTLHPKIEKVITDTYNQNPDAGFTMLSPQIRDMLLQSIANTVRPYQKENGKNIVGEPDIAMKTTILLTSEIVRPFIYKLLSNSINKLQYSIPILSLLDISNDCKVENIGYIDISEEQVA